MWKQNSSPAGDIQGTVPGSTLKRDLQTLSKKRIDAKKKTNNSTFQNSPNKTTIPKEQKNESQKEKSTIGIRKQTTRH